MSAQTGTASIPPPLTGSGLWTRLRSHFARLTSDPNPVWMRELRQSARLQRTPVILATITGMMTLLICSVGGVASVTAEPAKVGSGIFHTFFSLAFAVVTWIGPAVAASSIAGERGGRTWEALLLTGLPPATIARGKFLASLTYVSLYIVMLAPVGALPFLFGGVTASEVLLAFVILFCVAGLSAAFGLAISSKFSSPAAAIIVTLLVTLTTSFTVFGSLGIGLSFAVHDLWPGVAAGPPVWLPTAYVRGDFGLEYITFLLVLPVVLVALPGWLFYEVTVANLAAPSDDRSTRLRVWFLVSTPICALTLILVGRTVDDPDFYLSAGALLATFLTFGAFLFTGEPLGPSRRVLVHWQRRERGRLLRFLGPGILRASVLLLALDLLGMGALLLAALWASKTPIDAQAQIALHGYLALFLGFLIGFGAWSRSRSNGAAVPRVLLLVTLFFSLVGPWIAMAIAGIVTESQDRALLMAAPSPTYVAVMVSALKSASPHAGLQLFAGTVCASAWGAIGLGLLGLAAVRTRRRLDSEEALRASLEARFAEEDQARLSTQPPIPDPQPPTPNP